MSRILNPTDLVAILLEPFDGEERLNSGERRVRVLSDLKVGESGVLVALELPLGVQNHLMHMGFVTDAEVKAVHKAPAGDPTVYSIDGIEIALRRETAQAIQIRAASLAEITASALARDRGALLGIAAMDSVSEDKLVGAGMFGARR